MALVSTVKQLREAIKHHPDDLPLFKLEGVDLVTIHLEEIHTHEGEGNLRWEYNEEFYDQEGDLIPVEQLKKALLIE
jgi:hypothetical protein